MSATRPASLTFALRTAVGGVLKGTQSHADGLELLFIALPDALARRKMLDTLEKAHARLLAREDGGGANEPS